MAGCSWSTEVSIVMSERVAMGTMGAVRASSDNVQTIVCALRGFSASTEMTCYATDSAGVSVRCGTNNPNIIQALSAITTNSHLRFAWDTSGRCTSLYVENYSSNPPVQP